MIGGLGDKNEFIHGRIRDIYFCQRYGPASFANVTNSAIRHSRCRFTIGVPLNSKPSHGYVMYLLHRSLTSLPQDHDLPSFKSNIQSLKERPPKHHMPNSICEVRRGAVPQNSEYLCEHHSWVIKRGNGQSIIYR